MEPQVGDVITTSFSSRVRTVLEVDGEHITYKWVERLASDTTVSHYNNFYDNSAYKITRSKQYLISKFNEVWKNS